MPILIFEDFKPDQFEDNDEAAQPINANPDGDGFTPIGQLSDTDPLFAGAPVGDVKDINIGITFLREIYKFLFTSTRIYRATSSGLTDLSRAANYSSVFPWESLQYLNAMYAVNGVDVLQKYVFGDPTFLDVAVPNSLTGRHLATSHDFLHLAYTTDSVEGNQPNRWRWSGIGLPDNFTPAPETQSDYRDLPGMGEIRGITGGDYVTLLQEKGVRRGDFVGPPSFWVWDDIADGAGDGAAYHTMHIKAHETTFYYSKQGWRSFDGAHVKNIGLGRVNNWFERNLDKTSQVFKARMVHFSDLSLIGCGFISLDTPDGNIDRILCYNYDTDKWTLIAVTGVLTLGLTSSRGTVTLEELDVLYPGGLETIPGSLDDEYWNGDPFPIAGVWTDQLQAFFGDPMVATLYTAEQQFFEGRRAVTDRFQLLAKGGSAYLNVGVRTRLLPNTTQWSSNINVGRHGGFNKRVEGVYHRLRATFSGDWRHAKGVDVIEPRPGSKI
jgi:hypothetical protein